MPTPTIDGDNLVIILPGSGGSGVVDIDVVKDLYSYWKIWFKTGDNAKYPIAFDSEGGSPITLFVNSGTYTFLRNDNGWRLRPAEEHNTYNFTGNIVGRDVTLPITTATLGNFTVLINGIQPITQAFNAPTAAEIADAVWNALTSSYGALGTMGRKLIRVLDRDTYIHKN